MKENSKFLGVITARGGSKRLKRKNALLLLGKPLIAYVIEAAKKSKLLDRVIVTTDDEEIANTAKEYGAEVPFMRPDELATDTASSEDVVRHAVEWLEKNEGYNCDFVVTLQPTSPLVDGSHIDTCIEKMTELNCDSVISVIETPYPPYWMYKENADRLKPFLQDKIEYDNKHRTELEKTYQANGAVYVTKRDVLMNENRIIGKDCGFIVMNRKDSIDIDTIYDFKVAETIIQERKNERNHTI